MRDLRIAHPYLSDKQQAGERGCARAPARTGTDTRAPRANKMRVASGGGGYAEARSSRRRGQQWQQQQWQQQQQQQQQQRAAAAAAAAAATFRSPPPPAWANDCKGCSRSRSRTSASPPRGWSAGKRQCRCRLVSSARPCPRSDTASPCNVRRSSCRTRTPLAPRIQVLSRDTDVDPLVRAEKAEIEAAVLETVPPDNALPPRWSSVAVLANAANAANATALLDAAAFLARRAVGGGRGLPSGRLVRGAPCIRTSISYDAGATARSVRDAQAGRAVSINTKSVSVRGGANHAAAATTAREVCQTCMSAQSSSAARPARRDNEETWHLRAEPAEIVSGKTADEYVSALLTTIRRPRAHSGRPPRRRACSNRTSTPPPSPPHRAHHRLRGLLRRLLDRRPFQGAVLPECVRDVTVVRLRGPRVFATVCPPPRGRAIKNASEVPSPSPVGPRRLLLHQHGKEAAFSSTIARRSNRKRSSAPPPEGRRPRMFHHHHRHPERQPPSTSPPPPSPPPDDRLRLPHPRGRPTSSSGRRGRAAGAAVRDQADTLAQGVQLGRGPFFSPDGPIDMTTVNASNPNGASPSPCGRRWNGRWRLQLDVDRCGFGPGSDSPWCWHDAVRGGDRLRRSAYPYRRGARPDRRTRPACVQMACRHWR